MKTEMVTSAEYPVTIEWDYKMLTTIQEGGIITYYLDEAIQLRDFLNQIDLTQNIEK